MSTKIALICDDHRLIRKLEASAEYLADLSNKSITLKVAKSLLKPPSGRVDVCLVDSCSTQLGALNLVHAMQALFPSARKALIFDDTNRSSIVGIDWRLISLIPRSINEHVLCSALQLMLVGEVYFPGEMVKQRDPHNDHAIRFTDAQRRIIQELLDGKSNKVIAFDLSLSLSTVKSHLSAIYRLLNVRSRAEALQRLSDVIKAP